MHPSVTPHDCMPVSIDIYGNDVWNSPPKDGPADYKSNREVRRFKMLTDYQG